MSDSILHPKNRFIWSILAFQGGFVNIGGLLTIHIFVSHITGFSAHFSESLINGELLKAILFLLCIVVYPTKLLIPDIFPVFALTELLLEEFLNLLVNVPSEPAIVLW